MKDRHTILASLRAKPGKSEALGKALANLVPQSRQEEDCFVYNLHRSVDDPDLWVVYEIWRSPEALEAHFEMPFMKDFVAQAEDLVEGGIDLRAFHAISTHLDEP